MSSQGRSNGVATASASASEPFLDSSLAVFSKASLSLYSSMKFNTYGAAFQYSNGSPWSTAIATRCRPLYVRGSCFVNSVLRRDASTSIPSRSFVAARRSVRTITRRNMTSSLLLMRPSVPSPEPRRNSSVRYSRRSRSSSSVFTWSFNKNRAVRKKSA